MANKISKRDNIMYNDVSDQRLTYANQLTIKAWNDIINVLKTQANINAMREQQPENYARIRAYMESALEGNRDNEGFMRVWGMFT